MQKKHVALSKERGECIEKSLIIEGWMDILICNFLFGADYQKHQEFRDLILNAEFCTFSQKRRIIQKTLTEHPELFPRLEKKVIKSIINRIRNLIGDRNKLAHGEICFDLLK